jgi:hypothetical protein
MERFVCPVCNREVDDSIIPYHKKVEQQILDVIQKMIPRWYDGETNKKCIDYYRALIVNKTIK